MPNMFLRVFLSLLFFYALAASRAGAATKNPYQEKKLFTMKKSYNPENTMVIYAQVDENCDFKPFPGGSYINYYWLMNRKTRKKVHPLIAKGIEQRVEFNTGGTTPKRAFKASLNDLNEVDHDLPNTSINVISLKENDHCEAQALIGLGKSEGGKEIDLVTTYCEVHTNLFGVPTGCDSLQLQGTQPGSGKRISVKFDKK